MNIPSKSMKKNYIVKNFTLLYLSFEYLVYFKHNLVLGWIIGGMYAWEEMHFIDLYDDTIKCFNLAENFFLYSVFVVSFFLISCSIS